MAVIMEVAENWKADKENLHIEISSLKKSKTDFKVSRKLEWRSFKNKYNDDLNVVEKALKKLKALHKK
ncbi:MAG: hypothetical protein HXX14_03915 [Bacteroidetes bacterium]|nr:hypothetical protein [Bacteroidota bacterium]